MLGVVALGSLCKTHASIRNYAFNLGHVSFNIRPLFYFYFLASF